MCTPDFPAAWPGSLKQKLSKVSESLGGPVQTNTPSWALSSVSDSMDLGWGLRTCISDKFLGERTIALGVSAIISIFVAFTHQRKILSKHSWMGFLQTHIFIMLLKP